MSNDGALIVVVAELTILSRNATFALDGSGGIMFGFLSPFEDTDLSDPVLESVAVRLGRGGGSSDPLERTDSIDLRLMGLRGGAGGFFLAMKSGS